MNKEKQRVAQSQWCAAHPKRKAFQRHKSTAKQRGIEFLFNFAEWVEFWGDDFQHRGTGANDLCCARIGDVGPYTTDNCFIVTQVQNRRNEYVT